RTAAASPDDPWIARLRASLGSALRRRGQAGAAERELSAALASLEKILGADHRRTVRVREELEQLRAAD
ncbi:MAG: hypothetical protein AAGF23_17315, partial [Acidobacteriota bacterium]